MPRSKPTETALTRQEKVLAQRALSITSEGQRHASALMALVHDTESRGDIAVMQAAERFLTEVIKPGLDEIHEAFDSVILLQRAALDETRAKLNKYLLPLESDDRNVRGALNIYHSKLEDVRIAEARRAQQDQIQREKRAEQGRALEYAQRVKDLETAYEDPSSSPALIEKLSEEVQSLSDEPVCIVPQVMISPPPTTGMSGQVDNWKCEVIADKVMEVLKQVVAGLLPIALIEFSAAALRNLAKLIKDTKQVPGLRFYNDKYVRVNR